MKNVKLSPGGIIGALACGALATAIVFLNADGAQRISALGKVVLLALLGGAFLGNWLWAVAFGKPDNRPPENFPASNFQPSPYRGPPGPNDPQQRDDGFGKPRT